MEKEDNGVWRTIRGRRIFIKEGESLGSAMSRSGKFKGDMSKRKDVMMAKKESRLDDREEKVRKYWNNSFKIKSNDSKEKAENNYRKFKKAYNKLRSKETDDTHFTEMYDDKSQLQQGQVKSINTKGKTRTERHFDNYSKAEQRELRHENLQKKLADFKAKKQSNNKIDNDIYDKDRPYLSKEAVEANEKWLKEHPQKDNFDEKEYDKKFKGGADYRYAQEQIDKQNNKADPYDDPESNESQRLQSIQSRYDEYLQDTEGRGASYGEIAHIEGLRGKDLDDFEKELDDYEAKKFDKEEKATKKTKTDDNDWLPKATEIKEQGTSNRKEVSDNIQAHILEYYGPDYIGEDISPEDAFVRQMDAMKEPTMWKSGQRIAEGGSYLVYNGDMSDFLDSLKINPKGKKFSDDKAFQMYTSLIGRESEKLYNKIKKHQAETINKYKKRKGK